MRLLDSDVLIDLLRGRQSAVDWFNSLTELPTAPGIAYMELVQGCRNKADLHAVDKLLRPLTIVWPSEADQASALAHHRQFLLSDNVGMNDCLIAFTAVGRGDVLCTFNVRHYRTVSVLTTEQPYQHT